jgi:hypothetical protein
VIYLELLNAIIERGIEASKRDYPDIPRNRQKREGAEAGFKACRGKNPEQLKALLKHATERVNNKGDLSHYWYWVCYKAEVNWVCNCISVVHQEQDLPIIVTPTARAYQTVADILKGDNGNGDSRTIDLCVGVPGKA